MAADAAALNDRVLLIGAAGLVGRHVRAALAGHPVIATSHREPAPDAIPLDVTDAAAVLRAARETLPDAIILAAAEAHVERCEREPEATRRVNVEGARNAAAAAADVGARLVVFSSEYVFDGSAGLYREDDPTRPINEYGRQKVDIERIAGSLPRHLVCRTSGVYGWDPAGKNFVCQLLRRLRGGEPFDVPGDQIITPTYAADLGTALAHLVYTGAEDLLHVVGPQPMARVEFARLAARAFGLSEALITPRPTSELALAAPRPREAGLRDDRLRAVLGNSLRYPAEALAHMRATEPA